MDIIKIEDITNLKDFDFSCSANRVVGITKSKELIFWSLDNLEYIKSYTLEFLEPGRYNVRISKTCKYALIYTDGYSYLFNIEHGECKKRVDNKKYGISAVDFSSDDKYIAIGYYEEICLVYELTDEGDMVLFSIFDEHLYNEQGLFIEDIKFMPNGRYIASVSEGIAWVWDYEEGEPISSREACDSIDFTTDSKYIVTTDRLKCHVWETETGRTITEFPGHETSITSVAFLNDGKRVVSGSYDRTCRVWDAFTGEELQSFKFEDKVKKVKVYGDRCFVLLANGRLVIRKLIGWGQGEKIE